MPILPKISYPASFLRTISSQAKHNFSNFYIPQPTRAWIIALGIWKQPKPYRRSRAGQNLFHCIHQRITLMQENTTGTSRKPNLSLIREISKTLQKQRMVNISHVNGHSITNKVSQFQLEICDRNTDICAITETWIKQEDIDAMTKEALPQGYKILSRPRSGGITRGGLALVYRDHYTMKELDHIDVVTMKYQGYHLRSNHFTLNLYVVYCLPSSSILQFCNEFASILESDVSQLVDEALYLGDFNIHAEDSLNKDTITFINTLESYNLRNRVTFPMHVKQHQLDLVNKDQSDSMITHVERRFLLSDHFFVHSTISILKAKPQEMTVQFRKIKSIDQKKLDEDLKVALQTTESVEDFQDLVTAYNSPLSLTLNIHAPLKTNMVKKAHKQPWFNDRIREEIILRCKREKAYNKDLNEYTLNAFYQQRRHLSNLIETIQKAFLCKQTIRKQTWFQKSIQDCKQTTLSEWRNAITTLWG